MRLRSIGLALPYNPESLFTSHPSIRPLISHYSLEEILWVADLCYCGSLPHHVGLLNLPLCLVVRRIITAESFVKSPLERYISFISPGWMRHDCH